MNQPGQIVKQLVDLNKESVMTAYDSMTLLQKHTENYTNSVVKKMSWIPDEGKSMIDQWMAACKKNVRDSRNQVEAGYTKIKEMIDG